MEAGAPAPSPMKIDPARIATTLDESRFATVEEFRLHLVDTGELGMHLKMAEPDGVLAVFPWWDHADVDIAKMTPGTIPAGSAEAPFHDLEQGWEILIWENGGYVYVAQGRFEASDFDQLFRVPAQRYRSEWARLVDRIRAEPVSFDSVAEALRHRAAARWLRLGNQKLTELPEEIGGLERLEQISAPLNRLTGLPQSLGALKSLRWMDLRFNAIAALPESFGLLENLEGVNLAENRLSALPRGLAGMSRLRSFYVPGNPVPRAEIDALQKERPDMEIVPPSF